MRGRWRVCVLLVVAAGCHHRPAVEPLPAPVSAPPVAPDLPLTKPDVPVLDARSLPKPTARVVKNGPEGSTFRRLTEADCLLAAAAHAGTANLLDENPPPTQTGKCDSPANHLRRTLRYHTALEVRNRAAADALERFFQLTDAEARTDLLRKAFPILDDLHARASAAKAADVVRFPFDPTDLERQRSQLVAQLEQAELGSRLLDLDLKRRIGLPYHPAEERLWPAGAFDIDSNALDPEAAVTAALADRPELRGLRALYHGLTPDTLPDVRDLLGAGRGTPVPPVAGFRLWLQQHHKKGPDPAAVAELEVRRRQLLDVIATRERQIADEARAAALVANAQRQRAALARERVLMWEVKLDDAEKKRDAKQPGAEFQVPQVQFELLKARAELAAEVAAWHQARVRVKAAQGWLAWEAAGGPAPPPRP